MSLNLTNQSAKHARARQQVRLGKDVRRALYQYYAVNKVYPLPAETAVNPISMATPSDADYTTGYLHLKSLGIVSATKRLDLRYAVWNSAARRQITPVVERDDDGAGIAFDEPEDIPGDSEEGFLLKDQRGLELIDPRCQQVIILVGPQRILERLSRGSLTISSRELKDMTIITRPRRVS